MTRIFINPNLLKRMRLALLVLLAIGVLAPMISAAGLYRWVDENGRVHYGDSIPPKYSKLKREVLNRQGMVVETLAAQKTKEEIENEKREIARLEELKRQAAVQAQRNRILIVSYVTPEEIDSTRDNKVATIQKRLNVLDLNAKNLDKQKNTIIKRIEAYTNSKDEERDAIIKRYNEQLVATNKNIADLENQKSNLEIEILEIKKQFAIDKRDFIRLQEEREKQRNAENHPVY
ncbi:MAG: DUF4124 domain-containing protein [Gammaproteobacteria bacterium]|nr:DUF4124 domain-containing protein [Gammaproteobacteria bacterium]NNC98479.1 DUF4124 domain-containing protein [Gammaproteobacteria bacterium]NNM12955.1 DUF4124 domain-containing protein [Gammaproteobacteria bacterium]